MAHSRAAVEVFRAGSYATMPWANGAGYTEELHRELDVDAASGWGWRLSIATVSAAAPFSQLPGVDRAITVLAGAGLRLQAPTGAIDLVPGIVHEFPGERPIAAAPIAGSTRDLNLMVQRSRGRGSMTLTTVTTSVVLTDVAALVVIDGCLRYDEQALHAEDMLLVRPGAASQLLLVGSATLACIRIAST
jgi:uncharacterized protein